MIGTGYQVPDTWKFYEERDPRSRKAWMHAVAIMEMMTFTDAENALTNLDPDGLVRDSQFPVEDWLAAKRDA